MVTSLALVVTAAIVSPALAASGARGTWRAPSLARASPRAATPASGWEFERAAGSNPREFLLERFFAKHEFVAKHLLCCSDVEPVRMAELLDSADDEARALWDSLVLGYTQPRGLPLLLAEIAASYERVSESDLQECAPQEGVTLAMAALVRPGDAVVVAWPSYQSLVEVALCRGARATAWHARGGGGGEGGPMRFEIADLEAAIATAKAGGAPLRLLVVNFPHNPTGATLSAADWARVVALAAREGAYLFSDEMYRGLEPRPGAPPLSAAVDVYERGISLSGLSKVHGLPGLRIGWLASRDAAFLKTVGGLRDFSTICSAGPSQVLALMAMRRREHLAARARALIASGSEAAGAFFETHADLFEYSAPQAGPIGFPALRAAGARAVDVERYCEALVERDSILLLPATVYGGGFDAPRFRIGLGRADCAHVFELWDQSLKRGLRPSSA
jgi:aspartate/methionine/tyrosine aminotransferase